MTPDVENFLSELAKGDVVHLTIGNSHVTYPFPIIELASLRLSILDHVVNTAGRLTLDLSTLDPDVDVCKCMIYYMLRKELPDAMVPTHTDSSSVEMAIKCWCFCDRLGIAQLQDNVMRHIINSIQQHDIPSRIMLFAFQKSSKGSLLRKLFAEYISVRFQNDRLTKEELARFKEEEGFDEEYEVAFENTEGESMYWVWERFEELIVGNYLTWTADPGNG